MQEDTQNNMQERGDTTDIRTSTHNDFGELAPQTYERGQGGHKPENKQFEPQEESPVQAQFRQAEEKTAELRAQFSEGKINREQFGRGLRDNIVKVDGVLWSQGVKTGEWHRFEAGNWVPAEPPTAIAPEINPTEDKPHVVEDNARWTDFEGTDWGGSENLVEETTVNPALVEDERGNWYRKLSADWKNRPQTTEYWVGNKEKGIEDKRPVLQMAGMSDQEINVLIREHTIQDGRKPAAMPRPEDMDVLSVSNDGRGETARSTVRLQNERQLTVPKTEAERGNKRDYLNGIENLGPEEQIQQIRLLCKDIQYTYPELTLRDIARQDNDIAQQIGRLEREMRRAEADSGNSEIDRRALMEAKVFIGLHDTVANLLQVNPKADEVERDIKAKYKTLEDQKRTLSGVELSALHKNRVDLPKHVENGISIEYHKGLAVGQTYTLLQEVSTRGIIFNGKNIRLGGVLQDPEREAIDDYLKQRVRDIPGVTDVSWTLELARMYEKFSYASSLKNLSGSDPVAKGMYLQQFRESTLVKKTEGTSGDDLGPLYTRDAVPTVGMTSLERFLTIKDANGEIQKLAMTTEWNAAYQASAAGDTRPLYDLLRYDPYNPARSMIVDTTQLQWERVTSAGMKDYFTKAIPASIQTTDWFLRSDWSLSELRKDTLEKLRTNFITLDPNDDLVLAPLLVTGILVEYQMTVNPTTEKTQGTFGDPNAVRRFLDLLKREPNPFLSAKTVDYIEGRGPDPLLIEDDNGRKRKLDPVAFAHNISLGRAFTRPVLRTTQ